jgi:hypothetical protein
LRQPFEEQCDDLAMPERQRTNHRQELAPALLSFVGDGWVLPRRRDDAALVVVEGLGARSPPRQEIERAVVRDTKREGSLRALSAKRREGLPQREGEVLEQIVSSAPACAARMRASSASGCAVAVFGEVKSGSSRSGGSCRPSTIVCLMIGESARRTNT